MKNIRSLLEQIARRGAFFHFWKHLQWKKVFLISGQIDWGVIGVDEWLTEGVIGANYLKNMEILLN
jgi:hypothetical protein